MYTHIYTYKQSCLWGLTRVQLYSRNTRPRMRMRQCKGACLHAHEPACVHVCAYGACVCACICVRACRCGHV